MSDAEWLAALQGGEGDPMRSTAGNIVRDYFVQDGVVRRG